MKRTAFLMGFEGSHQLNLIITMPSCRRQSTHSSSSSSIATIELGRPLLIDLRPAVPLVVVLHEMNTIHVLTNLIPLNIVFAAKQSQAATSLERYLASFG